MSPYHFVNLTIVRYSVSLVQLPDWSVALTKAALFCGLAQRGYRFLSTSSISSTLEAPNHR